MQYSSRRTVFNITNLCNFNCPNCYSFNNYLFDGHREWAPYAELYAKWSTIFNIGEWKITGGEPMLNPNWYEWVEGVHLLWPNNRGEIFTNGSLLTNKKNSKNLDNLYNLMKNSKEKLELVIGLHDLSRYDDVIKFVIEFLGNTWESNILNNLNHSFLNRYALIKATEWPELSHCHDWYCLPDQIKKECREVFDLYLPDLEDVTSLTELQKQFIDQHRNYGINFTNKDGVKVVVYSSHIFYRSIISYSEKSKNFTLQNTSDVAIANSECQKEYCSKNGIKLPGSSELAFFDGKLYKCNTVRLLQEFDSQHNLSISQEDKNLFYNYRPASLDMSIEELDMWFSTINNPISACKFCPTGYTYDQKFSASTKKIFIKSK